MVFYTELKKINRKRNLKTKAIKKALKIKALRLFYRKNTLISNENYKNVCIFMHAQAIGDAIVSSGFIQALRRHGLKVFVLVPDRISFMFIDMIQTDGVFIFDGNHKKTKSELSNLNIDFIIDLSDFDTSSYDRLKTLFYVKPKHSVSFNQPADTIFDTNIITKQPEHVTRRMISVLQLLGAGSSLYPAIAFNESSLKDARDYLSSIDTPGDKIIIFNPFASQKNRNLPSEKIDEIITFLNGLVGYKTIVFNLNNPVDVSSMNKVYLNPFSDAARSFALVEMSEIVITVDTAVVHLAAALNKRQFCIYNNRLFNGTFDNNILWGPNSDKATQLTTSQFLETEEGDNMGLFDTSLLIKAVSDEISISLSA